MKWVCAVLLFVGYVYSDSNVIDFGNLPDFTSLPGADIKHIERAMKNKCQQSGGNDAYKSLKDSVSELKKYIETNFKAETIDKEIKDASTTGSLDEVFKKYCDLKPDVMKHVRNLGIAIKNCLKEDEKAVFKVAENVTEGLIDFACDKDGERIALFIVEEGVSCIRDKADDLQKCGTVNVDFNTPIDLDKIPDFKVTKERCDEFQKVQACILKTLEECNNSTPSNVVDSLLTYIYKVSSCSK